MARPGPGRSRREKPPPRGGTAERPAEATASGHRHRAERCDGAACRRQQRCNRERRAGRASNHHTDGMRDRSPGTAWLIRPVGAGAGMARTISSAYCPVPAVQRCIGGRRCKVTTSEPVTKWRVRTPGRERPWSCTGWPATSERAAAPVDPGARIRHGGSFTGSGVASVDAWLGFGEGGIETRLFAIVLGLLIGSAVLLSRVAALAEGGPAAPIEEVATENVAA